MFNNNQFNQIRPRPNLVTNPVNPVAPATNGGIDVSIQNLINSVGASNEAVNRLVAALSNGGDHEHDTAFSTYPAIDLTVAHTDLEITTSRPIDWLQVWCDGSLDGISIKIGRQSNQALDMRQVQIIRVSDTNPEKIYFTNDVRQGRSKAIVYFVRGSSPLTLALAGQDISQAEVAARLNSISTFDRRGDVMWQDSGEDGLQRWVVSTSGLAYIVCSTGLARTGSTSLKMYNPAAENCQLIKSVPFASQSPFGFEASFARDLPGGTTNIKIKFELDVYDGTNYLVGQLIYNEATTSLYYLDAAGADVLLSNAVDIAAAAFNFSTIKLVIDTVKKQYVRCVLNGYVYNLRNIPLFEAAAASSPFLESIISLETADGASESISYIDDVIITNNEP